MNYIMNGDNRKKTIVNMFDKNRTIIKEDKPKGKELTVEEINNNLLGLTIYIVVFIFIIPHFLLKKKQYAVTALYLSNVDMIATVIGFGGGPDNIWRYLYNPTEDTYYGFFSSSFINLLALIGIAVVCFNDAAASSTYDGISRYIIAILITYLIPGNFIVYIMNKFSQHIFKYNLTYYFRYAMTITLGIGVISLIIYIEKNIFLLSEKHLSGIVEYFLKNVGLDQIK